MSRPRLTFLIDNGINDMTEAEYKGIDFQSLFAAGAASVALAHGMSEKDAQAFTISLCKDAATRRIRLDNDEEDEDTFWNRNKKWLIPTIVGSLAYYIGADGERHGRRDRGFITNSINRVWDKTKILLGMDDNSPVRNLLKKHPEVADTPETVIANQEEGK